MRNISSINIYRWVTNNEYNYYEKKKKGKKNEGATLP